jgi:hypothetical protein
MPENPLNETSEKNNKNKRGRKKNEKNSKNVVVLSITGRYKRKTGDEKILFDAESEAWRNNCEKIKRIINAIYRVKNKENNNEI